MAQETQGVSNAVCGSLCQLGEVPERALLTRSSPDQRQICAHRCLSVGFDQLPKRQQVHVDVRARRATQPFKCPLTISFSACSSRSSSSSALFRIVLSLASLCKATRKDLAHKAKIAPQLPLSLLSYWKSQSRHHIGYTSQTQKTLPCLPQARPLYKTALPKPLPSHLLSIVGRLPPQAD